MPENCPIDITPLDQSSSIKTAQAINLNYTNQDFWSMKSRLVDFLNERFGPNGTVIRNAFTDLVESSIAIMLIENWAFLADTLSFKMDQHVNEIFIDTVTEVENAFRLSKLVGFKPTPPIAARSLWSVTINQPLVTDLSLPTPISIDITSQDTPRKIELFAADADNNPLFDHDIIIPAGSIENISVVGLEGRTITESLTGTGETSQSYRLGFFPVIWGSIRLQVDGVTWDQVDYFTDSQPRLEYRIEYDSQYNGYIMFGNNRAGAIPSQGSIISATYRVGGGTAGNITTGAVQTQRQSFVEGLDFSVPTTFRNYKKGEYGYDGDNIEDVRRKLPAWVRTQDRAVTDTDYKTLADQFATAYHGQIGKATAVLRNHGCAGNIVDIYVLARSDGDSLVPASVELKADLIEEFNDKKMVTDFVCIRDGVALSVDVAIDISVDKVYRKFEQEIRENINRRVNIFFGLNNWEYGKTLKDTDLIKQLSDLKQLESIDITFTSDDEDNSGDIVTTKFFEIIRPDSIEISFMFT